MAMESSLVTEPQLKPLLGEGGWEMAAFQKHCICQLRVQVNRPLQERRGGGVGISIASS